MQRTAKPSPSGTTRNRQSKRRRQPVSPELKKAFARTLKAAKIERQWFGHRPMMTERQIAFAKRRKDLVGVKDVPGKIRIVQTIGLGGVQYALLAPACKNLLTEIANQFSQEQARQELEPKFLSITSMTRSRKRQDELIAKGYPAARESTHGLGEAFDINVTWFRKNSPTHFQILKSILEEMHNHGRINLIDETAINGALHIARNPRWRPK